MTDSPSCSEAVWDARASAFDEKPIPGDDDQFVSLVLENADLDDTKTVLDVGCGTGTYSLPIAGRVRSVTGLDVSSKMIEYATRKASSMNLGNARYIVHDWHTDGSSGLDDGYDVVIAHMTPAISSYDSFMKMYDFVRGSCFITRTIRRGDQVRSALCRDFGLDMPDAARDMVFSMNVLWNMGHTPKVYYESRRYDSEVSSEEMKSTCLREFGDQLSSNGITEKDVSEVVDSLSDGKGTICLEGIWQLATIHFSR